MCVLYMKPLAQDIFHEVGDTFFIGCFLNKCLSNQCSYVVLFLIKVTVSSNSYVVMYCARLDERK